MPFFCALWHDDFSSTVFDIRISIQILEIDYHHFTISLTFQSKDNATSSQKNCREGFCAKNAIKNLGNEEKTSLKVWLMTVNNVSWIFPFFVEATSFLWPNTKVKMDWVRNKVPNFRLKTYFLTLIALTENPRGIKR